MRFESPFFSNRQLKSVLVQHLSGEAEEFYDCLPESVKSGSYESIKQAFLNREECGFSRVKASLEFDRLSLHKSESVSSFCKRVEFLGKKVFKEKRDFHMASKLCQVLANMKESHNMLSVLAKSTDDCGLYEKVKQKALELEEIEIIRSMSCQRSEFSHDHFVQDRNAILQQRIYSTNQEAQRCPSDVVDNEDDTALETNAPSYCGLHVASKDGSAGIIGNLEPINGTPVPSQGRELRRRESNPLQVKHSSEPVSVNGRFSNSWHKRQKMSLRCYGCHGLGHKYHACPSKKMKRVGTHMELDRSEYRGKLETTIK
jgi:hypothetical protein